MSSALQDKVAVVTGGSSGIGLASAKRLADAGAIVFITGRRQAELDAAVKAIGDKTIGVQADVSKPADLDRLYETVRQRAGHLDVLFANAGVQAKEALGDISVLRLKDAEPGVLEVDGHIHSDERFVFDDQYGDRHGSVPC